MNILILANYDEGLYKFRKELLERLVKDNRVFISVPSGKYIEKIKDIGCKVKITEYNRRGINPIEDIKLIKTYRNIIKEFNADVILTYTIKPNVYGGIAAQSLNVPYIANITGLGAALENKGLLQTIPANLYKIGLKKANMVYFQNESNKKFMLEKGIVKKNYDLIPGSGVNLEHFKVSKYPTDDIINFVYVSRIMKQKGVDEYIEAAKQLKNEHPNVKFHICGFYEDNYKSTIDELAKENIIIYHGVVTDMADVYKDMHCTVLPTYYPEGLSNVLLESLASARPIITTDRPGCKEVVEDGINGFITKQKDSNDLIKQIEKFLSLSNKEKEQLGLNGRKKVEKQFSREIVINKYLQEIEKIRNEK